MEPEGFTLHIHKMNILWPWASYSLFLYLTSLHLGNSTPLSGLSVKWTNVFLKILTIFTFYCNFWFTYNSCTYLWSIVFFFQNIHTMDNNQIRALRILKHACTNVSINTYLSPIGCSDSQVTFPTNNISLGSKEFTEK